MYECHITLSTKDAAAATEVATRLHWKTSEIARDPVLGDETYFYLTSHAPKEDAMRYRLQCCATALRSKGIHMIRQKIEHIIFDAKFGDEPH